MPDVTMTPEAYEVLRSKAEKLDKIEAAVARFYPEEEMDDAEQEGDLSDIALAVLRLLGYPT